MATLNIAALRQAVSSAMEGARIAGSAEDAIEAAEELISMLESEAASNGISADFGWTHGSPIQSGDKTLIDVYPSNDMRSSLYNGGVESLVDLFSTGYEAGNYVYGEWHGERIRSRLSFGATNFFLSAVDSFRNSSGLEVTTNRG